MRIEVKDEIRSMQMKLFWRVSRVQWLSVPSPRHSRSRYYSTKPGHDPLRILFCGSEEFSIASLRALHDEHVNRPDIVASIDVVCRPGKRVGRGLRKIREGAASET